MRMPEIIPVEPKKKREYDYARECLDEAKETKRRFIHIMIENGAMDRGHIDAPSEFVYIWYNGDTIYIRADEGPVLFTFPLRMVSAFGDCDGSDMRTTWERTEKWIWRQKKHEKRGSNAGDGSHEE